MKIAVLYIALGRYEVFFKRFYSSAKKHLLPGEEKHFFVFTDSPKILKSGQPDVTAAYRVKKGWPYDTLERYDMFLSAEDKLKEYDYIYFFNSNMLFLKDIREEILPGPQNDGLTAAVFFRNKEKFTYDRNPESKAYIEQGQGINYYLGGLNGGKTEQYLDMLKTLKQWVDHDLSVNYIARCHDESYLNKYLLNKNPLILERNYIYPEQWDTRDCPGKMMIKLRDKDNPVYGGSGWMRGSTEKKMTVIKAIVKHPMTIIKNIIKRRNWWKYIS